MYIEVEHEPTEPVIQEHCSRSNTIKIPKFTVLYFRKKNNN